MNFAVAYTYHGEHHTRGPYTLAKANEFAAGLREKGLEAHVETHVPASGVVIPPVLA